MSVPEPHHTGRTGVYIVGAAVHRELGWIFREISTSDVGIDGEIEIVTEGRVMGRFLRVQIKSGDSYFDEPGVRFWVHRPTTEHVEYWLRHAAPVLLLLVSIREDLVYWQHITPHSVVSTGAGWKVNVPADHVLNQSASSSLYSIANLENRPDPLADNTMDYVCREHHYARQGGAQAVPPKLHKSQFPAAWDHADVGAALYAAARWPDKTIQLRSSGNTIALRQHRGMQIATVVRPSGEIINGWPCFPENATSR